MNPQRCPSRRYRKRFGGFVFSDDGRRGFFVDEDDGQAYYDALMDWQDEDDEDRDEGRKMIITKIGSAIFYARKKSGEF